MDTATAVTAVTAATHATDFATLLRLAQRLDMPLRVRNACLLAANRRVGLLLQGLPRACRKGRPPKSTPPPARH